MSLRDEIAGMRVRTWKNLVGDDLADEIINKILDAAVEAQFHAATELGIDRHAKHYIEEAINKLRGE